MRSFHFHPSASGTSPSDDVISQSERSCPEGQEEICQIDQAAGVDVANALNVNVTLLTGFAGGATVVPDAPTVRYKLATIVLEAAAERLAVVYPPSAADENE